MKTIKPIIILILLITLLILAIREKHTTEKIINKNFTIACFKNAVQILELQKEGKKKMTAREFLIGNKLKVGTSINSDV